MAQEDLLEPAGGGSAEDTLPESTGCHSHGDLTNAARHGVQGAAEEVGHAAAEDCQGQTGDILVGAKRDGQEAVEQAAQRRGKECRNKAQQQRYDGNGVRGSIFIGESTGKAGNTAQLHDPGNTQVQVTGFLGDNLAKRAEEDDRTKYDGRHEQVDHLLSAPFFLRKTTR